MTPEEIHNWAFNIESKLSETKKMLPDFSDRNLLSRPQLAGYYECLFLGDVLFQPVNWEFRLKDYLVAKNIEEPSDYNKDFVADLFVRSINKCFTIFKQKNLECLHLYYVLYRFVEDYFLQKNQNSIYWEYFKQYYLDHYRNY